jgi:hypothetical protein
MGKNMIFTLSLLYLLLLAYNIFAAQLVSSAISLFMFLLTSPFFFKSSKAKHPAIRKAALIAGWIPLATFAIILSVGMISGGINVENDDIPAEEQLYIDTVLSQITSETTKEEAIELLGKPSRDLVLKVNWWVSIDGRNSRIGVYFSSATGKAEDVILDGGWGRFYYRKALIE